MHAQKYIWIEAYVYVNIFFKLSKDWFLSYVNLRQKKPYTSLTFYLGFVLITRSILNPLLFQILKKEGVTVEVIRELTEKGTNYHFIRHYLICIDSHLFKKCFINVILSLQWWGFVIKNRRRSRKLKQHDDCFVDIWCHISI